MTVETFEPPDIEKALVAWLEPRLSARVSTRVPNPRPALFVTVRRIGGVRANLIQDAPIVLVECWGSPTDESSNAVASNLAHAAYRHMVAMPTVQDITPHCRVYAARVSGPVNNPDTSTNTPRYHLTATLRTRMVASPIEETA